MSNQPATAAGQRRFVAWLIRVNNVIRTGGLSLRRQVPHDYHCLRCDRDVPADEVHEAEWMPGRVGTFHSCGDYAHRQSRQGVSRMDDLTTTTAAKVTEFAEMVVEMLDEHEVAIGCEHTVAEVAHAIAVEADDFFGRAPNA